MTPPGEALYLARVKKGEVRPATALRQLLDEFDTAEGSIQRILDVCERLGVELPADKNWMIRWLVEARIKVVSAKNRAIGDEKAAYYARRASR